MAGNALSVALWVAATDFRTFLASRVVGGLSEGNVQLANAIAADISDESQRGATMALVGACFSIAFTCGPALGAALASVTTVAANPFATAAGFSLLLILIESAYLYLRLPETHPRLTALSHTKSGDDDKPGGKPSARSTTTTTPRKQTNPPAFLNAIHLLFLLPFSGLEFSLPFLTATLYADKGNTSSPAALNGRLLSLMGLIASLLQATLVRRLPPLLIVRAGVVACAISFFLLARVDSIPGLYAAGALLAVTSATVVTGLNSLGSLEAAEGERGAVLGRLRSSGQVGRAVGPVLFCSLFWWAGREVAYWSGGLAMLGVCAGVFLVLKEPAPV